MAALPTDLRNLLENTIKQARIEAEKGAHQALDALAVGRHEPHGSMSMEERKLRNRLRAHGRQLGDVLDTRRGTQTTHRLMREVAYEQWHRMLFARFLAENHLLIHPGHGVAVSLEECEDLARASGGDPWVLAASFAQAMLPQIFRAEDPGLLVTLPPETRVELQKLLVSLPTRVFTEDDALGWTYQFWQSAEKDAVNERAKSGEKITGETLPAVTQLFTEPYMVHFLLDNTIGAWHAGKLLTEAQRTQVTSEGELREAVRLHGAEGYDFEYLRFVRDSVEDDGNGENDGEPTGAWRPAAGAFDGWPRDARELTVLDPCCGSGHFLVSAFRLLVPLRMAEEGLSAADAARAVIRDNLFGLELDARCTQIAAFNLALAAWKVAGTYIDLPPLRIACSGVGPQATKEEWLRLAEEAAAAGGMSGEKNLFGSEDTLLSAGVKGGLEALYDLFQRAPDLGSLIEVRGGSAGSIQMDALQADFAELAPLMDAILTREGASAEEVERAVAAKGMAEAAKILAGPAEGYTLVITNVPYLGRHKHDRAFRKWASARFASAKWNLATMMIARLRFLLRPGGSMAIVSPQDWFLGGRLQDFRQEVLASGRFDALAFLGPRSFETISGEVVNTALFVFTNGYPPQGEVFTLNAQPASIPIEKARSLRDEELTLVSQKGWAENPGRRISVEELQADSYLGAFGRSWQGIKTSDDKRFVAKFWEFGIEGVGWWRYLRAQGARLWSGREHVLFWEDGHGTLTDICQKGAPFRGSSAWGQDGVAVNTTGALSAGVYLGEKFASEVTVITAEPSDLAAILRFTRSDEFPELVRRLDKRVSITTTTFTKVPYAPEEWEGEEGRNAWTDPQSPDPTQWLFHGHPAHSDPGTELHVALVRLLGYRWPAESDPEMRLSDEARALIRASAELDALGHADDDGIVCLSPVRGEGSAADRLRALLGAAFGDAWSTATERELLAATANAGQGTGRIARNLDAWLRDSFFEEHCKLFQHRPFIWHVWDGQRDGFNALVNYHRLSGEDGAGRKTLESLTYTYLGEWVDRQRKAQEGGEEGADGRLAAALRLQEELRKILEGEPPYDLFVRWKPLHEQPMGWDPDVNDGVRLNIRPFMLAGDVGRKAAGILRWKPNTRWTKDGGKEPEDLRPRDHFPWFWGCDPDKEATHRVDFGAGTPNAAPAGQSFDGARWNGIHYTRAAKAAARGRAKDAS